MKLKLNEGVALKDAQKALNQNLVPFQVCHAQYGDADDVIVKVRKGFTKYELQDFMNGKMMPFTKEKILFFRRLRHLKERQRQNKNEMQKLLKRHGEYLQKMKDEDEYRKEQFTAQPMSKMCRVKSR